MLLRPLNPHFYLALKIVSVETRLTRAKGIVEREKLPSDTHLREVMDEVDNRNFRRISKIKV